MERQLSVHTRRSDSTNDWFRAEDRFSERFGIRFRPLDPLCLREFSLVISVVYEVYDDQAAMAFAERQMDS